MSCVPKGYVKCKTTAVFGKDNIPDIYAQRHFTRSGVYEQIHVMSGELMFYGYKDKLGEVEREVRLKATETAISHPEYWHSIVPLTDDIQFEIHFYMKAEA